MSDESGPIPKQRITADDLVEGAAKGYSVCGGDKRNGVFPLLLKDQHRFIIRGDPGGFGQRYAALRAVGGADVEEGSEPTHIAPGGYRLNLKDQAGVVMQDGLSGVGEEFDPVALIKPLCLPLVLIRWP